MGLFPSTRAFTTSNGSSFTSSRWADSIATFVPAPIAAPIELNDLVLASGERVEFLVEGDREPKQYRLLNQSFKPGPGMMGGAESAVGMMGTRDSRFKRLRQRNTTATVATLTYNGVTDALP